MNKKLSSLGLGLLTASLIAISPTNNAQGGDNALSIRMFLPNVLSNRVTPPPADWRIAFIINSGLYFQDYLEHRYIMQINGDGLGIKKLVDLDRSTKNYATTQKVFMWSPDSKKIAYLNQNNLGLLDVDSRITKTLVANTDISTLAWSPDSDSVSYAIGKSVIAKYDLKTNAVTTLTSGTISQTILGYFDNLSLVPDFWRPGESLYSFSNDNNKITLMRSDGSNLTELGTGSHPTWGPTYDRMAYVRPQKVISDTPRTISTTIGILTFDRDTGIKSDIALCSFLDLDQVLLLDWSPDGKKLLINVKDKEGWVRMYHIKTDGSQTKPEPIEVGGETVVGNAPVWGPDSESIIYSDYGGLYSLKLGANNKPINLANFYMMSITPARIAP